MTATIPLVGFLDRAFHTFIRFERHGFPQPRHGWDQQVQKNPLVDDVVVVVFSSRIP